MGIWRQSGAGRRSNESHLTMAFAVVNNVSIKGITACVPTHVEENLTIPVFKEGEAERVIAQTGIERKHTVEQGTTVTDLCAVAFEKLITELDWDRSSVEILILVSSAGDYITPPSANVLHGRLALSEDCLCYDIRQGCPGWVVGMSTISSLMQTGNYKRAVLLCGDSSTIMKSPRDKETRPLFGDAGTATALEYDEQAAPMYFHHGSRGKDFQAIMAHDGGLRHPFNAKSLEFEVIDENIIRRPIDSIMHGMDVFGFALSVAPKSIQTIMEKYGLTDDDVDFYLFHQANMYLNEKIRKKLKLAPEKVPYSLRDYGNTGPATIPLTLVSQCRDKYGNTHIKSLACAFGVGLAWASMYFETDNIICPEVILY